MARGRVVRVADPERGQLVPRVERFEVGQPARLLAQRHRQHARACEQRAALVHRVRRLGHGDDAALADRDLREREDRLLRAERRHDLARADRDAVAALDPRRDRLAQLGQPGRTRVRRQLADPGHQRVADERGRHLARVADTEVDHVDPTPPRVGAPLVEPCERVLLEAGEDGRELHAESVYQNARGGADDPGAARGELQGGARADGVARAAAGRSRCGLRGVVAPARRAFRPRGLRLVGRAGHAGRRQPRRAEARRSRTWRPSTRSTACASGTATRPCGCSRRIAGRTRCCSSAASPGRRCASCPSPSRTSCSPALLRRLWRVPPEPHPFRPLAEMTASWRRVARRLLGLGGSGPRARGPAAVRGAAAHGADARPARDRPARRQRPARGARAVARDRPEAVRRRPGLRRDAAPPQLPAAPHRARGAGRALRRPARARPRARPPVDVRARRGRVVARRRPAAGRASACPVTAAVGLPAGPGG